jgi:LacI family transcriptional regulator
MMPAPFRVAFALNLATEAAVRWFCVGAHKFAHQRLDWTILRSGDSTILSWEQAIALRPDAILGILEPWYEPNLSDPRHRSGGSPHVVILNAAARSHPFHTVTSDDVESGRRAAAHLIERRLTRFAFVGVPTIQFSNLRRQGFEQELRHAGVTGSIPAVHVDDVRARSGEFRRWLGSLMFPCGVLCANDGMGLELVKAARGLGVGVPDDLAIIGVSNDEMQCVECPVTLTSIFEDFVEVGYRAAAHADDLLRGRSVPSDKVLVPPGQVVERESTRVFGEPDPLVRRALLLMDQDDGRPMTVDRLLAALGDVSRRSLEMRFRTALGRSPYQEILHARIRRAQRLMRHTRLPVSEVALRSGFYDTPQFCRHFKRIAGLSPMRYRAAQTARPS